MPLGAYRTQRVVPAERLVKLPDVDRLRRRRIRHAQGTDGAIPASTSCYPVKAGDTVLVHAAAGGVGLLLGQWLKVAGRRCDRHGRDQPDKAGIAPRRNGYAHVIDTSRGGLRRRECKRSPRQGLRRRLRLGGQGHLARLAEVLAAARHVRELRPIVGTDHGFQALRPRGGRFAVRERGPTLFDYIKTPRGAAVARRGFVRPAGRRARSRRMSASGCRCARRPRRIARWRAAAPWARRCCLRLIDALARGVSVRRAAARSIP